MLDALLYGAVVGISLGLTGGGGSIFAVPLLLYGLGLPLRMAVTVSLAVVGITALYGALVQRRAVQWRAGGILGLGGIAGAPFGAWLGTVMPEQGTLILFAGLMLLIAWRMWRGTATDVPLSAFACRNAGDPTMQFHWACAAKLASAGVLTGVLSGLFGVGGGFLVVPALLLVLPMAMEKALATSLVSIALISASAFAANIFNEGAFPHILATWFLAGGGIGMSLGVVLKTKLSTAVLRRIFAIGVGGVAVWILVEIILA